MHGHFIVELSEAAEQVRVPAWQFVHAMKAFAEFYDPLRIYLFGSRVWGNPHCMSDLDVCVLIPNGDSMSLERNVEGMSLHSQHVIEQWEKDTSQPLEIFPIDLLLIDREYYETRISNPATLESTIHRKGKLIFTRPDLTFEENRPMIYAETNWLKHAEAGYVMATKMIEDESKDYRETALLGVHQCVEMALGGFLAFHLQEPRKDHNILSLITQCMFIDRDFEKYLKDGDRLTKYFYIRYFPNEPVPERNTVFLEIWLAEEMLDFVKEKIAKLPRPSTPMFLPEPPEPWDV